MSSSPIQPEHPDHETDSPPEAFVAELRSFYGHTPAVPSQIDASILNEAKVGFARRRQFQLASRVTWVAAAAAAVVAFAFVLPAMWDSEPTPQQATGPTTSPQMLMVAPPAQREDVDHNGRVDILDAFVVAKLIDARQTLDEAWDINGDGKVDQADVDRIAVAAVDTSNQDRRDVQ